MSQALAFGRLFLGCVCVFGMWTDEMAAKRQPVALTLSFSGSEQKVCTPRAEHLSAAHIWPDRRVLLLRMKNLTDDAEGDFQK